MQYLWKSADERTFLKYLGRFSKNGRKPGARLRMLEGYLESMKARSRWWGDADQIGLEATVLRHIAAERKIRRVP